MEKSALAPSESLQNHKSWPAPTLIVQQLLLISFIYSCMTFNDFDLQKDISGQNGRGNKQVHRDANNDDTDPGYGRTKFKSVL